VSTTSEETDRARRESSTADAHTGYVHRPTGEPSQEAPQPGDFGRAGWVLVAIVVLSFLVIPGIIYLRPATPGNLGFSFFAAMLVLPMVPALLLGLTAVWSMGARR
jgi:hypothetical protein